MDRSWLAAGEIAEFAVLASDAGKAEDWIELTGILNEQALRELLRCLVQLDPPERIHELKALEQTQDDLGAGFYGMLPQQISEDLPVPSDEAGLFATALALAKIRSTNLVTLESTFTTYSASFFGRPFPVFGGFEKPTGWQLSIDVSGMQALVGALANPETTVEDAHVIASQPAFTEMMTHRRELGYVPEPLIDGDGLAWCIQHAASDDPADRLWRWLHPHNFFDLSDVRGNLEQYAGLVKARDEHRSELEARILGQIGTYVPADIDFDDDLTFAVGWAINGWATRNTGGINLEHFKDDFDCMLTTLTHETFHRLQLTLCPADPSGEGDDFEHITNYALENPCDEALYRVLSYVALEGSATYIGDGKLNPAWDEAAEPALVLLSKILAALDSDALEEIDGLLTEGLKSNGPFYGFGALLSDAIVRSAGPQALGLALRSGTPHFVHEGLSIQIERGLEVEPQLSAAVNRLVSVFSQYAGGT